MFKVNQYFDGKVVSVGFKGEALPATVGVMAPGDYEFDTSKKETMTVVSGEMTVKLPGEEAWNTYKAGDSFIVSANAIFHLKIASDVAYLCTYE
jgi:hypothetical protein